MSTLNVMSRSLMAAKSAASQRPWQHSVALISNHHPSTLLSTSDLTRRSITKLVRIICQEDLPTGKAYKGDVIEVKAGYARNYLIPQKFAIYATRQNFKRLGIKDPAMETAAERQERLRREALSENDQELKAANVLRKYFSNKALVIWRETEEDSDLVPLNRKAVTHWVIRKKLGIQLKIDLDRDEAVHLKPDPVAFEEVTEEQIETMLKEDFPKDKDEKCKGDVRKLGDYLARIWLKGDHLIPLKVSVVSARA